VLLLAITFETLQQQYYLLRFNLADDIYFFDLLKNQAYRWAIWIALGFVLIPTAKRAKQLNLSFFQKGLLIGLSIVLLVGVNIILISLVESALSLDGFSMTLLWTEFAPFFTYQKAPIYLLGYIAVSIILDQELINSELQFKVQALSEVKKTNQELYEQLAEQQSDKSQVLNIKLGNKRKLIAVSDILWIASDDYCVKVHTATAAFTMRSSLKQLETTLGSPFLRIHRQTIVNMKAVTEFRANEQPAVLINNDTWLLVSKNNMRRVKTYLEK
jgi:hypothetical protein